MNVMKPIYVLLVVLFIFIVVAPYGGAIRQPEQDIDTEKYGDEGDIIPFSVFIENDNAYPVDIKANIIEMNWYSNFEQDEVFIVRPYQIIEFIIYIHIPSNPDVNSSTTYIVFSERASTGGNNDYEVSEVDEYLQAHLNILKSVSTTPTEIVESNSQIFLLMFIVSAFSLRLWQGRKYYLLAPFYMNIPKEKLLNHENREKISNFLATSNGSNLSEISVGTGINIQTLRHHMKLFEQSNVVLKKDKRFFIKKDGSEVFDTEIMSPVLQRLFDLIRNSEDGITVSGLLEKTGRSKPWIGNRINDLLTLDIVEIVKVGRYKYIYPKGSGPTPNSIAMNSNFTSMAG